MRPLPGLIPPEWPCDYLDCPDDPGGDPYFWDNMRMLYGYTWCWLMNTPRGQYCR
jgi:hypothetical protein